MTQLNDITNITTEYPNYFGGQYLLAEDFALQHKYLSDRQKYFKSSLYVSGIIEGLEVTKNDETTVTITKGSAINNLGQLIVLKEDIPRHEIETNVDGTGELFIAYQANLGSPQQGTDGETRWHEEPTVGYEANPTDENSVKLATITISGGKISVETGIREYSGISLPNSTGTAITLRSVAQSNTIAINGSLSIEENILVRGTIIPSTGNYAGNGIAFKKLDSGSDDYAWIRYYTTDNAENRLVIGMDDSGDGDISLMPERNVGIGVVRPSHKLEVGGNQKITGDLTVEGKIYDGTGDEILGEISADKVKGGQFEVDIFSIEAISTPRNLYGYITVKNGSTINADIDINSPASSNYMHLETSPAARGYRVGGTGAATGIGYRIETNPNAAEPIFQIRSADGSVGLFVEHEGWTGSEGNSAWFGGTEKPNYFAGKVGIGNENPSHRLTVQGDQRIEGDLEIGGNMKYTGEYRVEDGTDNSVITLTDVLKPMIGDDGEIYHCQAKVSRNGMIILTGVFALYESLRAGNEVIIGDLEEMWLHGDYEQAIPISYYHSGIPDEYGNCTMIITTYGRISVYNGTQLDIPEATEYRIHFTTMIYEV